MNYLYKIAGLLTLCAIVSCHKNQLDEVSSPRSAIPADKTTIRSSETIPANWNAVSQPSHSVFYTTIDAGNITADVDRAVVRVFKTDASGNSRELPFEENNGSQKSYWYYEVMDGSVMISVDVYGPRTNPATNSSFKYVILDNAAVQQMEGKGISRNKLLQMPYDDLDKLNH